jgi:hypothetical protein
MNMNWKNIEILRSTTDEGDGGGSFSGDDGQPAPVDKTAMLEKRLEQMQGDFSNYVQNTRQQTENAEREKIERGMEIALRRADDAISAAERALATAYDEGEGAVIAKAQRELSEAVAKKERTEVEVQQAKNQLEARVQAAKTPKQDTTNLDAWKAKNEDWYGVNAEMTKKAHEFDRQVRAAGVLQVGTQEYFAAVDRLMVARYPEYFGGSPSSATITPGAAAGGKQEGKIRFGRDQIDAWKRMGINTDDPETLKRMAANRQTAVEKGFLPEEPARGRVRS